MDDFDEIKVFENIEENFNEIDNVRGIKYGLIEKCKTLIYDIIMYNYSESKYEVILKKLKKFIWLIKDSINSIGFPGGYGLLMLISKYNSRFHIQISEILIENGMDINNVDHHDYTALHHAIYNKNLPFIKFLLENGADCNIPDEKSNYPLMTATLLDDFEVVQLLIESGARINVCSDDGVTPLYLFIQKQYVDLIFDIMDTIEPSNFSIKTDTGHTLLMIACEIGNIQIVKYLLKKGVNVYERSIHGWNALHYAARCGHLKILEILCKHGLDINLETNEGDTCLFLIPIYYMEEFLHLSNQINIFHTLPLLGENIIHYLCSRESNEFDDCDEENIYIMNVLLTRGVPINQRNEIGNTPLHNASVYNKKYVVELFLRSGAIMDIRNKYGYTPCHIAAIKRHYDILSIFYMSDQRLFDTKTSDERNVYDILNLDPSFLESFHFSRYDDYDENIKKISLLMKSESSKL